MNKFIKLAGASIFVVGLAACGGGSSNNNGSNNNGSNNGGSSSGTPVTNRTGEANYTGTFNAKVTPQGSFTSNGKQYTGGDFKGTVLAEADFDEDMIDVDLIGTPKATVMERYEAEFDDALISGGKFSGTGRENITANGGSLTVSGPTEIDGSFNADGSKISGTTASKGSAVLQIESDFSASEK